MEQEPQSPEQEAHKLRNFLFVVGSLVLAGILGAEFAPMIINLLGRIETRIPHPTRRLFGQVTKNNNERTPS